jgi:hypothetical protein
MGWSLKRKSLSGKDESRRSIELPSLEEEGLGVVGRVVGLAVDYP